MKRWLYLRVLEKLKHSKDALERYDQMYGEGQPGREVYVSPDEIIKASGYPRWLIKRAVRWQQRKRLENSDPPFLL